MSLYLGFDAGTQSLSATVIEATGSRRHVVFDDSVLFDSTLPHYGTRHGVLPSADPRVATAPPLMWIEALEIMMDRVVRSGLDLSRLRAVSGAAQQHGSVYLTADGDAALAGGATTPLAATLKGALARETSPIWLDCSTTAECQTITAAAGGAHALARLTGSRAYERFTAAQIRRFAITQPAQYRRTARIQLVSSFLASALIGHHAPLEPADASGMNLMDLERRAWAPDILCAVAPDLNRRLPPIVPSDSIIGELSPYWQRRYGFPPVRVIAWTGDNPSSQIGVGLVREDEAAVSLGTSDTIFRPLGNPIVDPGGSGHVFSSPTGGFLALTCFANGSLARERVRDLYGLDWAGFTTMLRTTEPANNGAMMLPWFVPEITPRTPAAGPKRYALGDRDAAANVRAVVEGQMIAMRLHSQWMGGCPAMIRATGGAAANRDILQVMADVFSADVIRIQPRNAASLGAALRAWHGDLAATGAAPAWDRIVAGFTDSSEESRVAPRLEYARLYARMTADYEARERAALAEGTG
jgi:xylulokinase